MPVMVLRNLNLSRSIMNRTVLIYDRIINNCLTRVKDRETVIHHILKIELAPKDDVDVYQWRRTPFPVRLTLALIVARSEGQTCQDRVAVYTPEPVFAHGSLYVVLSRVTDPRNLCVCSRKESTNRPARHRAHEGTEP